MSAPRNFHIVLKAKPSKKAFFLAVMQSIAAAMPAHASIFVTPPVDFNTFTTQVGTLAT
jgi:hypothetical protein